MVALATIICHNKIVRVCMGLRRSLRTIGGFAFAKFKRLLFGQVTFGLLVILSILSVLVPVSGPAIDGVWTPLSLSTPDRSNDLVSGLPRTNELANRPTVTLTFHDATIRKTGAFPLWVLISSCAALAFRLVIARFVQVIRNITWFHYLFHLVDIPPPSSILASV